MATTSDGSPNGERSDASSVFEQERERDSKRQFGGHYFLEDNEAQGIDPACAATDAEELIWTQQKLVRAEAAPRLTSSELRLALWSRDLDALRQLWGEREQKLTLDSTSKCNTPIASRVCTCQNVIFT